jgi:hypothetical protein
MEQNALKNVSVVKRLKNKSLNYFKNVANIVVEPKKAKMPTVKLNFSLKNIQTKPL